MILIIPIILGAAAVITAGVGVAAGIDGMSNMEKAKKIGKNSESKYKKICSSVQKDHKSTQNLAEQYGKLKLQVQTQTIKRCITLIKQIGQKVTNNNRISWESFEGFSLEEIQEYKTAVLEAEKLITGGLKSAGMGAAAGQSAVALVGLFGTASTGTAIGGLSGAAAWNATLAWLGGGSLTVGGGGMALGAWILGGIAVGPALMVGGFVLGGEGEKSITNAYEYQKKVNIEIEKLKAYQDFLGQVQQRIKELTELVNNLNNKAIESLIKLESRTFITETDAAEFQRLLLLIKALHEIMKTPILDNKGNLNRNKNNFKQKYGNL